MKVITGLIFLILLLFSCCLRAQEEGTAIAVQGTKYISLHLTALKKYNERLKRQQEQMLKKLKKKEKQLANRLQRTDSLAYARMKQQPITYDSIGKMLHPDSAALATGKMLHPDSAALATSSKKRIPLIDSLKGIALFVQSKSGNANTPAGGANMPGSTAGITGLNEVQGQLDYRSYINDLIAKRTNDLEGLAAINNIPGFTGIEKTVFYGKAKMNAFKEMEEEPTKAEDKALEYLEGTSGFDGAIGNATQAGPGSMQSLAGSGAGASALAGMGYQTQQQMQASLQQKFGGNLGSVAGSAGGQISQFQSQAASLIQQATDGINEMKQTRQSLQQVKNINAPSFKVNPMRGLPFLKRIQKQYSWQTAQPTIAGQPAVLDASAMAGYKQTPKLTYGVGIAASMGLGQSWSNVHLSFEGLGWRNYITWDWQYGIGIYTGYERMYKQAVFINSPSAPATPASTELTPSPHNTATYAESILAGLTKSYKISARYNGAIQVLYDIWWREKGLSSPIVLRFATVQN